MAQKGFLSTANFEVDIDGIGVKQFTAVEGIGLNIQAQPYQEGAAHIQQTRKGRTSYPDIVLSKRFDGDKVLMSWIQDCSQKEPVKRNGSVILKDDNGKEVVRYNFTQGWPVNYEAPKFSTVDTNEVAVEKMTLNVETIELA